MCLICLKQRTLYFEALEVIAESDYSSSPFHIFKTSLPADRHPAWTLQEAFSAFNGGSYVQAVCT